MSCRSDCIVGGFIFILFLECQWESGGDWWILPGGRLFAFCGVFGDVWFFSRLHLECAGSAVTARKDFFLGDANMGIGGTRDFVLVSGFVGAGFRKCP